MNKNQKQYFILATSKCHNNFFHPSMPTVAPTGLGFIPYTQHMLLLIECLIYCLFIDLIPWV